MKNKDLKNILKEFNDELEIEISIDTSKNNRDYDKRAFGAEFLGTQLNKKLILLFKGFLNY